MTEASSTSKPKYTIRIDKDAEKVLRRQGRRQRNGLSRQFSFWSTTPTFQLTQVEGYQDLYRFRVGDWRIIYQVKNDQLLILVLEIGSRGEVYRGY